jgi:hypothetical protein
LGQNLATIPDTLFEALMNWMKPKTKKPAHYMDRIRRTLGFDMARSTIQGESSPKPAIERTQEAKADVLVLSSPVEEHKSLGGSNHFSAHFDKDESTSGIEKIDPNPGIALDKEMLDRTSPGFVMTNWDAKLQKLFAKERKRIQPKIHANPSSFVETPNFVSIFDQISQQFSQSSENRRENPGDAKTVATNENMDPLHGNKDGPDQRVPISSRENVPIEVVNDSQSENAEGNSTPSNHSRSNKRKVDKSFQDAAVNSPVFQSSFLEVIRPSDSIELIPQTPSSRAKRALPSKTACTQEQYIHRVSLKYSSSSDDRVTPIRCSNRVAHSAMAPKKRLCIFREEIHTYLDAKCKEMKNHIDQMINDWEMDSNSSDGEDYVDLFTPGCGDPFDE